MIPRPAFLVFEGLDGVGKSTCAKLTAELLGATYLTTPSELVRKYRDEMVSGYGSSREAQQLFYLSTVFAASTEVEANLSQGQSVVLDRYFLSTQVYAEFRGSRLSLDNELGRLLVPAHKTFFLDAPMATRRQRIRLRGCSAGDNETLTDDADLQLREGYRRRACLPVTGEWVHLDASEASPADIAEAIVSAATIPTKTPSAHYL